MDRLLLDLEGENFMWAECVRLKALCPKRSTDDLAQYTGTTGRQFRRLRNRGLDWLCVWVGVAGLLHSRQNARKSYYAAEI